MLPTYLRFTCRIASQISADDVHIKYFHHRQSPACLRSPLRRQAGGKCLGQIASVINVQVCHSVVPGYVTGKPAAYENDALAIFPDQEITLKIGSVK